MVGFTFTAGDKIRSAPIIIDNGIEKLIVVGSKDDNLYAINGSGELHFQFNCSDDIYTSPTVLTTPTGSMIFFGDDSGNVYALDLNGNLKEGYPISVYDQDLLLEFDSIIGSIVFEDIDLDGYAEIIFGDGGGDLHILKTSDNTYSNFYYYNSMPMSNTFSYSSSLNIQDIDQDGDLEIFGGTTGDVKIIDIKESSQSSDYWNIYRGNYHRNGLFILELMCTPGDINNDGVLNILDIVSIVNIIIDSPELTDLETCAADINFDGVIDILDVVTLVNTVISEN
jgi:hypothetical protein